MVLYLRGIETMDGHINKQKLNTGVVFASAVLLMAVLSVYFILGIQNLLLAETEETLLELSRQGAQAVSSKIDGRLDALETLARIEALAQQSDQAAVHEAMRQEVEQKGFLRMGIADENGEAYTTDGVSLNIGDRDYFQKAMEGTSNVSPNLEDKLEHTIGIVVYAVPIYQDGVVSGVLFATDYTQNIVQLISNITFSGGENAIIFTQNGTILASGRDLSLPILENFYHQVEKETDEKEIQAIQEKVTAGQKGTGTFTYAGVAQQVSITPISGSADWYLALAAPRASVMSKANEIILRTGVLLIGGMLLLLAVLWYTISLRKKYRREKSISRTAIRSSGLYLFTFSKEGMLVSADKGFYQRLGIEEEEGLQLQALCRSEAQPLEELLQTGEPFELELCATGHRPSLFIRFHIIEDIQDSVPNTYEVMGLDITESRMHEQEIRRLAYQDTFTGLPNRFRMLNLVERKFNHSGRKGKLAALVMVDLNKFHLINNTFGYRVGDAVLKDVAELLRSFENDHALAGRIGGDDFLLMLWDLSGQKELEGLLRELSHRFDEPFTVMDNTFSLGCNLGVAIYNEDGLGAPVNTEELMFCCELAAQKAAELQSNAYYIYNKELGQSVKQELEMEAELNRALQNQELELYLQPQYNVRSRRVVGFESLLRWNSAKYGQVQPARFIPIAERSGLIVDIGKFVIDQTFAFAQGLKGTGICISFNASAIELLQADYVEDLVERMQHYALEPGSVAVEITESCLIESFSEAVEKLYALRLHGVRAYLDDFGTGYSSLNYLKNLPLDSVKIDKSFIDEIVTNPIEESIVKTIVELSGLLHLKVIAEGVETERQMEYLEECGCNYIQGYYISRPVPMKQALRMLENEVPHGEL